MVNTLLQGAEFILILPGELNLDKIPIGNLLRLDHQPVQAPVDTAHDRKDNDQRKGNTPCRDSHGQAPALAKLLGYGSGIIDPVQCERKTFHMPGKHDHPVFSFLLRCKNSHLSRISVFLGRRNHSSLGISQDHVGKKITLQKNALHAANLNIHPQQLKKTVILFVMIQLAQKAEAAAVIHFLNLRILMGDPEINSGFLIHRLYVEVSQLLPQPFPVRLVQLSDIGAVEQRMIIRIDHRVPDLLDIGAAVRNQIPERILILD